MRNHVSVRFVAIGYCWVIFVSGCGDSAMVVTDRVSMDMALAALKSPNVITLSDYHNHLATLATNEKEKQRFIDLTKQAPINNKLDDYIKNKYQEGNYPGITPDRARSLLTDQITWGKAGKQGLETIACVHLDSFQKKTQAERIAHWDSLDYVTVFVDVKGNIVGWIHTE